MICSYIAMQLTYCATSGQVMEAPEAALRQLSPLIAWFVLSAFASALVFFIMVVPVVLG